jgi:hypothetical protein
LQRSLERADLALDIAEAQRFPGALSRALRSKASVAFSVGHHEEALGLLRHGLAFSVEHGLSEDAATYYFMLSDQNFRTDRSVEALGYLDEALVLARRQGSRPYEWAVLAERMYPLWLLGRWDEALAGAEELGEDRLQAGGVMLSLLQAGTGIFVARGQLDEARRLHAQFSHLEGSTDIQDQATSNAARAMLLRAEGKLAEALAAGAATIEVAGVLGPTFQGIKHGVVDALEAALALGDLARADELFAFVDGLAPASRSPYLDAEVARIRARLSEDEAGLRRAAESFGRLSMPFPQAVALLEHAELTGDHESRTEALEIFEHLRATPWIERATPVEVVA